MRFFSGDSERHKIDFKKITPSEALPQARLESGIVRWGTSIYIIYLWKFLSRVFEKLWYVIYRIHNIQYKWIPYNTCSDRSQPRATSEPERYALGIFQQRYVMSHRILAKSSISKGFVGFPASQIGTRLGHRFWELNIERILQSFLREIVFSEQVDMLPRNHWTAGNRLQHLLADLWRIISIFFQKPAKSRLLKLCDDSWPAMRLLLTDGIADTAVYFKIATNRFCVRS